MIFKNIYTSVTITIIEYCFEFYLRNGKWLYLIHQIFFYIILVSSQSFYLIIGNNKKIIEVNKNNREVYY